MGESDHCLLYLLLPEREGGVAVHVENFKETAAVTVIADLTDQINRPDDGPNQHDDRKSDRLDRALAPLVTAHKVGRGGREDRDGDVGRQRNPPEPRNRATDYIKEHCWFLPNWPFRALSLLATIARLGRIIAEKRRNVKTMRCNYVKF